MRSILLPISGLKLNHSMVKICYCNANTCGKADNFYVASILVNINCWKESEVWTKASCPATRSATVFLNDRFLVFRVNSRIRLPIGDSSTYYYFSWRAYWKEPIKFSSRVGQEREYKIALSRNTEGWLHYTTISKGVSLALMLPFVFAISYFLLKK